MHGHYLSSCSSASPIVNSPASPSIAIPHTLPLMVRYGFFPPITISTPTREVLCFVFAPPDPSTSVFLFFFSLFQILTCASSTNVRVFPDSYAKSPYDPWGEVASKLDDENFRAEYVRLAT